MLIVISPAKTLDYETPPATDVCTQPDFLEEATALVRGLSKLSEEEVGELMGISPKLAKLNKERFSNWKAPFTPENAKQAALAFKGDVYGGMRAWEFNAEDFSFAQKSLRILSGLYGLLRPLDLIQPYRLEMGTVYANPAGKDLYAFWGDTIAKALDEAVVAGGDLGARHADAVGVHRAIGHRVDHGGASHPAELAEVHREPLVVVAVREDEARVAV